MLLAFLHWLGASAAGQFLSASRPAFAATEAAHLLGLAALGGGSITVGLAAVGLIFRRAGAISLARSLSPLLFGGLALMIVSGLLLVSAGPAKYYYNPLFPWKLLALAVALAIQLVIFPGLAWLKPAARAPIVRVLGAASIFAWLTVTVIGRWVGLI